MRNRNLNPILDKQTIETLREMEEVLEEEKLSDNATEQKKRDFMKQMRSLDAKMFNYPKSSDYNSYSQSCQQMIDNL